MALTASVIKLICGLLWGCQGYDVSDRCMKMCDESKSQRKDLSSRRSRDSNRS